MTITIDNSISILQIPTELLLKILSYLDINSFVRFTSTCKALAIDIKYYDVCNLARPNSTISIEFDRLLVKGGNKKLDMLLALLFRKHFKSLSWYSRLEFELQKQIYRGNFRFVRALLPSASITSIRHCLCLRVDITNLNISAYLQILDSIINVTGIGLNFHNPYGISPLISACRFSNIDGYRIARFLLSKGADVNYTSSTRSSALMYAAHNSTPKTLNLLLLAGADISLRDMNGWDVLTWATMSKKIDNFVYLIKNGAKIGDYKANILHHVKKAEVYNSDWKRVREEYLS